jgi:hypothetical protein
MIFWGKVSYDPKNAAWFGSVGKLVKASKNKKWMWKRGCQVRIRTFRKNRCAKGFLEINRLHQKSMMSGKWILNV